MSLRISCPAVQSQVKRQTPAFKGTVLLNAKKVSPKVMDKFITEVVEVSYKRGELKTCGFKNWLGIAFADSAKALEQAFVKKVKKITPHIEHIPEKTMTNFEKMIQKWENQGSKKLLEKHAETPEKIRRMAI